MQWVADKFLHKFQPPPLCGKTAGASRGDTAAGTPPPQVASPSSGRTILPVTREHAHLQAAPLVQPYTLSPCCRKTRAPANTPSSGHTVPFPLQGNMRARERPSHPTIQPLSPLQGSTRAHKRPPPRPAVHPSPHCRGACAPASDSAFPLNPCPIGKPPAGTASALPAATVQTTVAPSRTGTKQRPLSAVTAPPAGAKTAPSPSPASPTGPGPQAGAHSL